MGKKILLAFILIAVLCGPAFGESSDKIVAIVNGDIITEEELNLFMKMTDLEEEGLSGADPQELRKRLLERLVEDRLILQEAKNLQVKIDETLVEDRVRDIRLRAGSQRNFENALINQGVSLNELREKLRNQFMIYTVIQREVKRKIQVSPKEVTDYFQEHESEFLTPEAVVVESIFVADKEALGEVQEQLSQGKDFAEVAKTYSKKSSIGRVTRGQLKKELEDFVFSLGLGQCSRPIAIDDGFYIFLVKEKLSPSKKTIQEVKDKIAAELENRKLEKALLEWLEQLKEKAYISVRGS